MAGAAPALAHQKAEPVLWLRLSAAGRRDDGTPEPLLGPDFSWQVRTGSVGLGV